jgi:thioesterase domain-containing protein
LQRGRAPRPDRLGGWSLGGVIAFEMARQLEQLGEQVAALVLIDSYPPDEWTRRISEVDIAAGFALDLLGHARAPEKLALDRLADMSADERLDRIREAARSLDLLDPDMSPARFRRFFETYRSNVLMYARYQPKVYGGGTLHLFRAREQAARVEETGLDSNRWPHFSSRGVEVTDLPGSHDSILHEPIVAQLADEMNRILDQQIGAPARAAGAGEAPAVASRGEP